LDEPSVLGGTALPEKEARVPTDSNVKLFEFLPKKPDFTDTAFSEHWRYVHAPLADRVDSLQHYVQSRRQDKPVAPFARGTYQGVAEAWFSDLNAALELANDPAYLEGARVDEPNFLDMSNLVLLFVEPRGEQVGAGRRNRTDRFKLLCFLSAADGITPERFDSERPSAQDLAAASSAQMVVQSRSLAIPGADAGPAFAGVDEIFFADAATASSQASAIAALAQSSGVVAIANSVALVVQQLCIY
jgi:hypothetical protein